ncbi:integral membrane sensor signal transduction histidine kinase [Methylocella silvestris BL2]|uniref:histidine kinase n=1 Tax=Methylocella silvestris (strain DSM 15510 / CIP 108128 / LMG 27833 / NCIMB 13906 / BL2) TaxID=395965 RepID=B8EMD2_METSB|nr:ATP-binding protein [Methylocella silvestris]ACK52060.1 integral membrane sensor signal transduction histidine kinase [Methylocella silvestris BL2]
MSIQSRLVASLTIVLIVSLAFGSALTYEHVLDKVRTEMQAAMSVGLHTAGNAVDDREEAIDPAKRLRLVVDDFNGDRHLRATLFGPHGEVLARSQLLAPDDPAPSWFYRLVTAAEPLRTQLDLPFAFHSIGGMTLEADPHNEVAEAWSDFRLTLIIMAVFFTLVLALAFWTIRTALSPLRDVCDAFSGIGGGDYATRVAPLAYRELEPLRYGFNIMAARLEGMTTQNRALHEQIVNVQEEERAELARDLHDEVAPFLFSVGADAAMIRQFLQTGMGDQVGPRADAISDAVRHMQRHLRDVLRRLAPGALLDLGLAGAIDNLIGFWKARRPELSFGVDVTEERIGLPLDAVVFRVVQESLSNAIRHGQPARIDVRIKILEQRIRIVVEDDGSGFSKDRGPNGFGLAGMQERVRSVGGVVTIRNRASRQGVIVEADIPIGGKSSLERSEASSISA